VLREGLELNLDIFLNYLGTAVFERITKGPMDVGVFYVHYAQTHHFLGVGAIEKLANLLDVPVINAPNLIGLEYVGTGVASVHANVSFVFSYYCYFGIVAFPFCLAGLWLLDVALVVYARISSQMLLPVVASCAVASASFISADYTTTLLTHGFATVLLVGWGLDAVLRRRRRGTASRSFASVTTDLNPVASRTLASPVPGSL